MKTQNFPLGRHLLWQFKSGLREHQSELLHAIEKAEKEIRDFAGPLPLDVIDLSCFTASKESLFARASQTRSRLRLIQRALEGILGWQFWHLR